MPAIQPLPETVQRAIAAGEVISSLGAAVQELVENALDAQAQRIQLNICPQTWSVEITDNGCGMAKQDLQRAALPYTTSKIHGAEDLYAVTTLGFRGEALHSLAQVGQLVICSRTQASENGWRGVYNSQGEVVELIPQAMAVGTHVTVHHLFRDWPHRRQKDVKGLHTLIQTLTLFHPQVTWQIQRCGRPWLNLPPSHHLGDRLLQLLPRLYPEDIAHGCYGGLDLVVGLPDRYHRHRPDWLFVGINGRPIRLLGEASEDFQHTFIQAFAQTLPRHRYPLGVAHFRLPPEQLDWHCHPNKREVYVESPGQLKENLTQAIRALLQEEPGSLRPWNSHESQLTSTSGSQASQAYQLLKVAESGDRYRTIADSTDARSPSGRPRPETPVKALAQVHQTYILAEHPQGLWLVEQHIAHERVLYEEIEADWQTVPLDPPIMLEQLTTSQLAQLQALDLVVEPFGSQVWVVRSAPALLAQRDDVAAALLELSLAGNLTAAKVAIACRSAIRNGTPLTIQEMQRLLDQWRSTQHPRTCPHGRPICLRLEESSLSRFFRRHWVIGKSHGI
ncbi:DNA mismatch repair endonuclease MutL [Candidatus Synechococcus calcipolaris G9]|uniref:DNA mismatch repair endonuclease MutL n=1 Tax=Candidatus Synechococcus calcipolaris G9 TaxID=1497997 RepID=A0ABT6F1T5_9SYNE|nr:DNA mismatch repair endonuclease MutL [Candidatus Synechococcus calcipolaris]MDG2991775.1 DNA mismatch repair endonuclease MutL [Candidatus Synechococcus calcipolaris G9]